MKPHQILNELSHWPYDLDNEYSIDFLFSKLPMTVRDLSLKILRTETGYQTWYSLEGICTEDKDLRKALCRLLVLLIKLKKKS